MKPIVKFFKSNVTLISVVIIVVSLLIITRKLSDSSLFITLNDTDTPLSPAVSVSDKEAEAQYNFLFYTLLYSSYPDTRRMDVNKIQSYIQKTASSKSEYSSIFSEISDQTEAMHRKVVIYNQDMIDNQVTLDVSGAVEDYILQKESEAKAAKVDIESYLIAYYKIDGVSVFRSVVEKYLLAREYIYEYLPEKFKSQITEQDFEDIYNEAPHKYNIFSLSMLIYDYPSDIEDKEREKVKKDITRLYDNTHSLEDFKSLSEKFSESNKATFLYNKQMTYDELNNTCKIALDYIISSEHKQDTAALFETNSGYVIVYFMSELPDNRPTYSGRYAVCDNPKELSEAEQRDLLLRSDTVYFKNLLPEDIETGLSVESGIEMPKLMVSGQKVISIDEEGLPYWKSVILPIYLSRCYEYTESLYDVFYEHYQYIHPYTP